MRLVCPTTSSASDITDSRGTFDLGGLEPGEYDVVATWPNQYGTRAARHDREERSKRRVRTNNTNVKLIIAAFGTITGRVVFDAKPMTYYGIMLTNEPSFPGNGQSPTGVRTDDGKFTLRNVGAGTWGLVLLGPGTDIKTLTDLEVQPGSTLDLGDITLQRGQRISGRVRDANGAVVADARVLIGRGLEPDGTRLKQWFGGSFETTTDSAGFFKFEGIAAHRDYMRPPQIFATHYKHGGSLIRDLPKGDAEIEMTLIGVGSIDGVVDGVIERFAWVHAQRTDEPDQARGTLVDSLGRFFFEDIPAGEYRIVVEGREGTAETSTSVTVSSNQRAKAKLTMQTSTVDGKK
jgi:hypothetical protein